MKKGAEYSGNPAAVRARAKYWTSRESRTFVTSTSADINSKVGRRHFKEMQVRDMRMNHHIRMEARLEQIALAKNRKNKYPIYDDCACGRKKIPAFKICYHCNVEKKKLAALQEGTIEKVVTETATANIEAGNSSPSGLSTPASTPGASAFIERLRAVAAKRTRVPSLEGLAASHNSH
jgi:hypothetical protein